MLRALNSTLLVTCAAGALAASADAAPLVQYTLYGQPGDQASVAGDAADPNITPGNMVRGAGLTASGAANSFSSSGFDGANDYVEISFTVADGYAATLDELWVGSRSSNTGPGSMGVYTSLDSFAAPIFTITQSGTNFSNNIIDLSELDDVTGTFAVRFMKIGNISANGNTVAGGGTWRVTEHSANGTFTPVQITGTTSPVPEPAGLGLLGLAAVAGLRRRRN